jgi:hypothetical protein
MTHTYEVRLGDRIKFRAVCRDSAETVVRKVVSFNPFGNDEPQVGYRGYREFVVRWHEIEKVVK